MAFRLVIIHRERGEEYTRLFHQQEVLVGRDEAADLCLDDPGVSLVHLSLTNRGGQVWLQDRGSTNGTTVAGEPMTPSQRVRLSGQDTVTLGPFQLRLQEEPAVEVPALPRGGRPSPGVLALAVVMGLLMVSASGALAWLLLTS